MTSTTTEGPKRNRVVMFSRNGCCLCDDALAVLERVKDELSLDITVQDIDLDPELKRDYALSIPVIFVNDQLALKGKVDPDRLRRRLKGGGILDRLSSRLGFRHRH